MYHNKYYACVERYVQSLLIKQFDKYRTIQAYMSPTVWLTCSEHI